MHFVDPTATKTELKRRVLAALDATRNDVMAAQKSTQNAATHEESKAESDKDMRSTELSYIARGQAMRVQQIETERARVAAMPIVQFDESTPLAVSALVDIGKVVFLTAGGGGQKHAVDGVLVDIVSVTSPLGEALVGAYVGDSVLVTRGGREEEVEVRGAL